MYEELIQRLRETSMDFGEADHVSVMLLEGADAIESTNKAYQMISEAYEAEVTKQNWIPVTERLPEAESGDTSKPVLVTDGDCVAIAEWFNFELSGPYWSYAGIGDITHWMPLPEPPKEE